MIDSNASKPEGQYFEHPAFLRFDAFPGDFGSRRIDGAGRDTGSYDERPDRSGDPSGRSERNRYLGSWSGPVERFVLPGVDYFGDEDPGESPVRGSFPDIHRGLRMALIRDCEHLFLVREDAGLQSNPFELSADYNVFPESSDDNSGFLRVAGDRAVHGDRSEEGEGLRR